MFSRRNDMLMNGGLTWCIFSFQRVLLWAINFWIERLWFRQELLVFNFYWINFILESVLLVQMTDVVDVLLYKVFPLQIPNLGTELYLFVAETGRSCYFMGNLLHISELLSNRLLNFGHTCLRLPYSLTISLTHHHLVFHLRKLLLIYLQQWPVSISGSVTDLINGF